MIRYVFICCPGHSGSTLLDLLLGAHYKITSLGEISHLSKNIALNTCCSCGVPIRDCLYWKSIISLLFEETGMHLLKDPYCFNLGMLKAVDLVDHDKQTSIYLLHRKLARGLVLMEKRFGLILPFFLKRRFMESIDNNILLYKSVLKLTGSEMIVDSSKDYLKAVEIYKRYPDMARVIVLCRDGRGVLYSRIKRGISRKEGIRSWKNYYERGMPIIKNNISREHVFFLKYEDLANYPQEKLKDICEFLEVSYDESMILEFGGYPHHIANGNNMRLNKEMRVRFDNAWMHKLSQEDLRYFEIKAGGLNKGLGYT